LGNRPRETKEQLRRWGRTWAFVPVDVSFECGKLMRPTLFADISELSGRHTVGPDDVVVKLRRQGVSTGL